MSEVTPEQCVLKLQEFARTASVDELIRGMADITRTSFDSVRLKRQLLRTLCLSLSLKILKDDYVDRG
jgi:hypothetical protein